MPLTPGNVNPQPPSLEKRLPLALALMMLVLLASQYIFKPAPGPKPVTHIDTNKAAAAVTVKPPVTTAEGPPEALPAGQIQAKSEVTTDIDTDLYHIAFSNRGGVVKSWILKDYPSSNGKPQQLVNQAATAVPSPFSIQLTDTKIDVDPNTVLYQTTVTPDKLGVDYLYSNGKVTIRKSFRFAKDSYLSEIRSEVSEGNTLIPSVLMWRGGFGDQDVRNATALQHTVRYDATASKLVTKNAKDAKNGPVTDSGNYTFGGLEDNFFAAVALPVDSSTLEVRTYSDEVKTPAEEKPVPYVGDGISTGAQNQFSLYIGPKDVDILRKVNPKLAQLVDWGFFGILAKPLFLSLLWVNDHLTNNYGWAIILVTIIINVLLFPFRMSSLKSARKMQKVQPKVKAINDKYKNIGIRDPKQAEKNQEVMDLYKKEGINPVGGCLPMLLQLPFFYAFYRVLNIAIELRHASWLWVPDLSQAETLPIHMLPIILIATQFFSQRLTPAAGVDPNQQKMMMFMPLLFGFMFYYASSGLVLYWLTGNLVGIAQQLIINRFMPAPPPPPPAVKAPVKATVKK
ncbi:MAG TPA: membrane protein insertase YidC [Bryobacteraceae bacterium]|jgi:YidC/Oxa1 family membrane protein insertase|nr:membrane protein insertase YidC [Bryobacteraceae bacterium]